MKCSRLLSVALVGAILALSGCSPADPNTLIASAKTYLAKGDANAATIQLKTLLQKNPNHAKARFLLGKSLLQVGEARAASAELQRALDLKYPSEEIAPLRARAMGAEGQFKKMVDQYASVQLPDKQAAADLKTSLAFAYLKLGNRAQTDASLKSALDAVPTFAQALLLQAHLHALSGNPDAGLELIERVLQANPKSVEAMQLKGDLMLMYKGEPAAAIESYRNALSIRKDLLHAHTSIISILFAKKDLQGARAQIDELRKVYPDHPQTKYLDALDALRRHDLVKAKTLAQQLLRSAPDYPRALHLAGTVEFELGSFGQAEKYLRQALQRMPDHRMARRLLVQTYLRSGQPAKALSALAPVIDGAKPDAISLSLAGEASLQSGDLASAANYFTRATKVDPKDARSATALALTQISGDSADAALAHLEDIAAADTGTVADLALISARFHRRELDGALKAVDALERKQPDKPLAAHLRGRIELERKDLEAARKSFERALAIDPAYFPATESLAAIDLASGKPKDARARYEKLLALESSNHKALLAIASLAAGMGESKEQVAELISRAVKLNPIEVAPRLALMELQLKHLDLKAALAAGQDAVAALPDSTQLLEALGRVQFLAGDHNQAISTFTKLATLMPQSPNPHLLLAEVYAARKNNDLAVQSLKRALVITPDSLQAQRTLVALELSAGRSQEALALAQSLQKQRTDDGIGHLFEGDIEASLKNFDGAANAYRVGLRKHKSPELAVKLHSVLLSAGRKTEAQKFAAGWLKDSPKDIAFIFHLGDVALAQGDYPLAESLYMNVLQLKPDDAPALNNIAWLAFKQKKKNALMYAEKANALRPGQPVIMDTLAIALAEENQFDRAVTLQKKAIELQPQDPSLRLTLAKIYVKAGDKARAKDELLRLSKTGAAFPGQAEVTEMLKTL
jgi:putative PEP-CTERM system TPR-repeat lipoprotein